MFDLLLFYRSEEGLKLIKTLAVPVDLSIPDAAEFASYEAEDGPKDDSKPVRRLRRRSDNSHSSNSGANGTGTTDSGDNKKVVKKVVKIGIESKYLSGTYSSQVAVAIHSFYNDLKIAYITCIKDTPIGSKLYIGLSDIFRFTVDLILREGVRLSLLNPQALSKDGSNSSASEAISEKVSEFDEEYDNEVLDGFHQIYSDVVEQYGEAFVVTTRAGPVFSSLDGKSALDNRDTLPGPPPGVQPNLTTTKILPQVSPLTTYQLSYISQNTSSVPHPSIPPTALMWGFTHSNAAPMPISKFLKYDEQKSFAPSIDTSNAMLNKELVESVWYQKYVQRRMVTDKAMVELLSGKEETTDENEKPEDKNDDEMEDVKEDDDKSKENSVEASAAELASLTPEDFVEALEWSPNSFIDDDELEAIRNGTEVSLISSLILELQEKQHSRLSKKDESKYQISSDERRLAAKIQNGIARLLEQDEITPGELGLLPDAKYPVLQASYMGTLPVPVIPSNSSGGSSKRYQSSRNRRR